jgi:hypothetical protein
MMAVSASRQAAAEADCNDGVDGDGDTLDDTSDPDCGYMVLVDQSYMDQQTQKKLQDCKDMQGDLKDCRSDLEECLGDDKGCQAEVQAAHDECNGYLEKITAQCWPGDDHPEHQDWMIEKGDKGKSKDEVNYVEKKCDEVCRCKRNPLNGYWLNDASLPFEIYGKYANKCLTLEEVHQFAWAMMDYVEDLEKQVDKNTAEIETMKGSIKLILGRLDKIVDRLEALEAEVDGLRKDLDEFKAEVRAWMAEVEARLEALEAKNDEQDAVLEEHGKTLAGHGARLRILEEWMELQIANGKLVYGFSPLTQVHGKMVCTFYGQCWAGPLTGVDFEVNFDKAALRFGAEGGFMGGVTPDEDMGYMFGVGGMVFPKIKGKNIVGLGLSFTYLRGGTEEDWQPGDSSPEHKLYAGTFDLMLQWEKFFGKSEDAHVAGALNLFLMGSIGAGGQTFLAERADGSGQAVRNHVTGVWMITAGIKIRFGWRSK